MFVTADQLVAHAVGDYILQSDWMANEKTKRSVAAWAHVCTYVLPFVLLTQNVLALAFIVATHFVIDRWRLARYLCWIKNFLQPKALLTLADGTQVVGRNYPWAECVGTGYHSSRPPWMAVWLMIIADNTLHVLCNAAALRWLV